MKNRPFLAAVALLHAGCAAMLNSSTDSLRVQATPASAEVALDNDFVGSAPVTVHVPRRGDATVKVSAPGYKTATCNTTMSAEGGYIAADVALCVLLFPIGCVSFIDAAGYWNKLDRNKCSVRLVKQHLSTKERPIEDYAEEEEEEEEEEQEN